MAQIQMPRGSPEGVPKPIPRQPLPSRRRRAADPPDSRPLVFLKLFATAWVLTAVLAVWEELTPVAHGAAALAWALTVLLIIAVLVYRRVEREPIEPEPEEDIKDIDPLTGLPTLLCFKRRLQKALHRSQRYGESFAVVIADVNGLGNINSKHGREAGDEVLRHIARSIEGTKRFSDVAARVGDDEFGIILLECDERGAGAFAHRLEDRLARESALVDIGGRTVSIWLGVCAGVTVCKEARSDPDEVLGLAVANLNAAKEDRNRRRRLWTTAA